jgi:hypothetical protein
LHSTGGFSKSRPLPSPTPDIPAKTVEITVIVVDAVAVAAVIIFTAVHCVRRRKGLLDDPVLSQSLLGNSAHEVREFY